MFDRIDFKPSQGNRKTRETGVQESVRLPPAAGDRNGPKCLLHMDILSAAYSFSPKTSCAMRNAEFAAGTPQ
jgi:hypothetical protein